jgi:Mrp family chromosome partitioning ATPase
VITNGSIVPISFQAASDQIGSAPEQAIGPYVQAVRRHWRLVAVITVLALLAAGFTVQRASSTYSASASVLVTPLPEGDAGFVGIGTVVDTGDPARTIQTAAALIDTPDAAARTARRLGKSSTASSVLRAVNVAPRGASNVMAITATAPTAIGAQRLANTFAEQAVAYRAGVVQRQIQASINQLEARLAQLQGSASSSAEAQALVTAVAALRGVQGAGREPTMSVSQTAAGPGTPNGTSKTIVLLLALVGGFAVGSITALGVETFSRPVRDRAEIESIYPLPILATLQSLPSSRTGARKPPWTLPPHVFEQLRMLQVQLSLSSPGRVIMVTSAGAGDGKTTVAAALAAAFAEVDKRVILMDLDVRKPDLLNLLNVGLGSMNSMLNDQPIEVPQLPGVSVIPPPTADLKKFEVLVQRLPQLLTQARRTADVVIIDTAPVGEVSEALRLAPICDQVVFVSRVRHTDRRRLAWAKELLSRAGVTPAGMVLIDKQVSMPPSDDSYAYAMRFPINGQASAPRSSAVDSIGDEVT